MTFEEYLKTLDPNTHVTFIKAKAEKNASAPGYHYEYQTTPIQMAWEWLGACADGAVFKDHLVLNADHPPIDIPGHWMKWYRQGNLKCCIVTAKENLYKMYSKKQAEDMIQWYEREVTVENSK